MKVAVLVILFNKTQKITCQRFTNFLRSEDFRQLDYTVKASQNLNLMWNMSTQWNQQLSKYLFSEVIECLEQNRKQIYCKRTSNTRQMNIVQNIGVHAVFDSNCLH